MAPGKRKRNDEPDLRPSPHRPQHSQLAQHEQARGGDMRNDGRRRSSRGGQGGVGSGRNRRNDSRDNNPNKLNVSAQGRSTPTPGPMSPPPLRPSSAVQTPTQTPTPTSEFPNPSRKQPPAFYYYEFLTEDRLTNWNARGRQEVIALGTQARQDEDPMDLATVFQEFTRAALDGLMEPNEAGSCVKEVLGPDTAADESSSFDPQTFFLDIFSMMSEAEDAPITPSLRTYAIATGISPQTMRQKLDGKLLQDLGLTRDTFIRVGVRQATNLLYRQANYNLLREETEGYSKLATELFTTSESESHSSKAVADTFERVKGLIGTFDLDVGRVLDITLDVFAAVLIKHVRFFTKLLRVSSWWPRIDDSRRAGVPNCPNLPNWALPTAIGLTATEEDQEQSKSIRDARDAVFWERARAHGMSAFFELGGRYLMDDATKANVIDSPISNDNDAEAEREWIKTTGTYPPTGNRVAAQLLGFKLRFYASEARDKEDILPHNLIYLTALLIKIGFISLKDLYPHLWPLDENMAEFRDAEEKKLREKTRMARGGGKNALTMASALPDDTQPRSRETATTKSDPTAASTAEADDKYKLEEPMDQKFLLLTCLLTIGAIPESLFILGKYPWAADFFPDIVDRLNRILHHSIKDLYETVRPISAEDAKCSTRKVVDPDQSGMPKGEIRLTSITPRKQLKWPFPEKFDTNENHSYRFYWDEWSENIPVCRSVDDLFTLCETFMNFSGPRIGKDAGLISKIVRIGKKSLEDDSSAENTQRWEGLLRRLLLPAVTFTNCNAAVVDEIWDMLKHFSLKTRYRMYAEWFKGSGRNLPGMKDAIEKVRAETNGIMKRISKTNIDSMARNLAKVAHSMPGLVFDIALNQIESYTNLTDVVVRCAEHFTPLDHDVLVWALLFALGGGNRNRNSSTNALLPSQWLLALSTFAGKVFKMYKQPSLSPILHYVNFQLIDAESSTDLVILKELISQMTGIVPDTDYTDSQLLAMTGGKILRKLTLINLQDRRYESQYRQTAKRLIDALKERNLAAQLLIGIAQYRQTIIYKEKTKTAHIKMMATLVDDTQQALSQYLDLLRTNLPDDEFDAFVPSIPELLIDFGLEPVLAFMIGRSSIAYARSKIPLASQNGGPKPTGKLDSPATKVDSEGDVGMEGADGVTGSNGSSSTSLALVNGEPSQVDVQMDDANEDSPASLELSNGGARTPVDEYMAIIEPIMATVQTILPQATFKAISAEFYTTFWVASSADLEVPAESYSDEFKRLVGTAQAQNKQAAASRQGLRGKPVEKVKPNPDRDNVFIEYKHLVSTLSQRRQRFLSNKGSWFASSVKADDVSDVFLERCLLPRLLLSPTDANYCFRMIKFLHENGVPHFRTLSLYGRIFRANRLRSIIFSCTIREAENLGRFLRQALELFAKWHADSTMYEEEAWGNKKKNKLPGFAKALDEDGKPKGFVDYDGDKGFKNILFFWHKNLNTALRDCLEGTEWMHIRNAITVLKTIVEVFPAVEFQGTAFIKQLETIAARENKVREDLCLTANAVVGQLKKRSKKWVMVQAFSNSMMTPGQNGNQTSTNASKSSLKPTAAEFKPQSRASSMGVSTPKPLLSTEVEDGEVDDAKTTAATKPADARNGDSTSVVAPPKSDILDRRDKIKREQAAANAAGSSSHSSIPPRPDTSRSLLDRGSPNLPNRPDAPFPPRGDLLDRHPARHGDRRDGRDLRLPDSRVNDRGGRPGDRSRDYSGSDRRPLEPNPRDFGRSSDRSSGLDRERTRPDPPPRWTADSRENLERSTNGSRTAESGRLSREMPPPRSNVTSSDRGPLTSDRDSSANAERQELINPERAALISGDKDTSRSDSPRRGRDEPRDRNSSRPQSPRRHASDKDYHTDSRRDDRSSRNTQSDSHSSSRRAEDIQPPPAGPRSDRPSERERSNANDRSSFQPNQPSPRPMDPDHGRLNTGSRQQPDPNFGRLNAAPVADIIPSGPRDRNSRGNRMNPMGSPMNNAAPRRDGRMQDMTMAPPRASTPEKQPPTGPASRHPRRSASGQFDQVSTPSTQMPNTPTTAAPPIAIHPDRLRNLPMTPQISTQSALPSVGGPPIHPDRLKGLNESPAISHHSDSLNNPRSRPNIPPVATSGPPSGPKGVQSSPIGGNVNGFAAPTGPASAIEREARANQRRVSSINTTIMQGGSQMPPNRGGGRGRGGRMGSSMGPNTPISAPSTPMIPPPPPPGPPPSRSESVREPDRDLINPARADLITNTAIPDDRDRERGGRRDRAGGRHSRRSSRSPARERDSKRNGPEDDRALRNEYRDRSDRKAGERGDTEKERHVVRSPARDLSRDLIPGSGRDVAGVRDVGSSRDSGRDRDRDSHRESGRRDGRERDGPRDAHDAGWNAERGAERGSERGERGSERGGGGRSRDVRGDRGDDRRDNGRGSRDDTRKRHSGEDLPESRGREKRPRNR